MEKIGISRFIEKRDIKDYLVSILAGAISGIFCLFFRWVINELTSFRLDFLTGDWSPYLRIPLYVAVVYPVLLLINKLIRRNPIVAGNGAEQTKGMLNGHIRRQNTLLRLMQKFLGSVGSLGSGMALGHEGPSIQFGGYLGVFTSRMCKVTPGREENILSAGASAGVAAALNAPLAGPVYIIESLQKLNNYRMAVCALLAGLTGGLLAAVFMPENPYRGISLIKPDLSNIQLLTLFNIMGAYMAVIGVLFTAAVKFVRKRFSTLTSCVPGRLFVLAVGMGMIGLFFPGLLGSGQPFMIEIALRGQADLLFSGLLMLLCFLFTAYSQGTTFPGGAFLPLLTLGGLSGRFFGAMAVAAGVCGPESLAYFMFLGMSACFVVVMRTPLTGFLLVAEMTGRYEVLLPSLAVGIVGYFLISTVRMQSLPGDLYEMLLKHIHTEENEFLTIYMEVMPNSYFAGKEKATIGLPQGCEVTQVLRDRKPFSFEAAGALLPGDQIEFSVLNQEAEQVYQALLSLSSDPR